MREIKFRAWDEQSNEYVYAGTKKGIFSFPLTISNPLSLCLDDRQGDKYENTVWCLNNDELIWCEYIGIKDINKIEIFENDIIKFYDKLNNSIRIGKVKKVGIHWFINIDDMLKYFGSISKIEVIGNIHENPELLKGNK